MRLFVALNLPKKERDRIYRATKVLRGSGLPVRWIDPENYHITLRFLGNVAEDRVTQVEGALTRVATATGKMDLMRSQVVKGGSTYSLRHRSAFAG